MKNSRLYLFILNILIVICLAACGDGNVRTEQNASTEQQENTDSDVAETVENADAETVEDAESSDAVDTVTGENPEVEAGDAVDTVTGENPEVEAGDATDAETVDVTETETGGVSENGADTYADTYEDTYAEIADEFINSLEANAKFVDSMAVASTPTGIAGKIFEGYSRDIFFANGTTIYIKDPDYDVSLYTHDSYLQESLGNGLGPDNPGYGAIIFWHDGTSNKYVYVSNMAIIYGGSYNSDLKSDVSISITGSNKTNAYPNVSFVFGGCMNGSLLGDVDISVNDGRLAYMYGGGFNGSVFGNVDITYSGDSRSTDVVGGGLAISNMKDEIALIYGDVSVNVSTERREDVVNCIAGGGVAIAENSYKALADVTGNVSVNVHGYNLYQICGGGIANTSDGALGMAIACVYGDSEVEYSKGRMRMEWKSKQNKRGIITADGLANDGIALVFGSKSLNTEEAMIDRSVYGVSENIVVLGENSGNCSFITRPYQSIPKCENTDYSLRDNYEPGKDRTGKLIYDERNKVSGRVQLRRDGDALSVWVYERDTESYFKYMYPETDCSIIQKANVFETLNTYSEYLAKTESQEFLDFVVKYMAEPEENVKPPVFVNAYVPDPEGAFIYME